MSDKVIGRIENTRQLREALKDTAAAIDQLLIHAQYLARQGDMAAQQDYMIGIEARARAEAILRPIRGEDAAQHG